ncbi:N-formylglutamate amidohydrolase [Sphingomonas ginsenosidivorax]|uniref:N-formylglutamate amidohydrolase n=1 Tax=Sphingomonas ginsenosidivorax TaxID=862135 RepID=A0A5C6UFA4_9SPHN|nr:N-formylglutamate amidohydrolase [Sphingomonas ginsenosidivorax]TXC70735.1 N-formylglutamate amidohydrolase [Sphingomonas ginsenosidivorax]
MNIEPNKPLLGKHDAPPVRVLNARGTSPFLLIGDHAGNAVPHSLGALGVSDEELGRHIGWDIGIGMLGERLAERIDAVFIRQTYSRLVIDCNRSAAQPDAIAAVSDGTAVPGNRGLSDEDRAQRFAEIHEPYQAAIGAELARRDAAGLDTTLVALHSFTPAMRGHDRPWHIGILHDGGDTRFAHAMLAVLRAEPDLVVGDNEPYRMDQIDYTIPRHAYPASRPYAEIEIRQDLLATPEACAAWADRLARILPAAAAAL